MAVPKRAPHGSFLWEQLAEWAVQQDWLTGLRVKSCSNWPSWKRGAIGDEFLFAKRTKQTSFIWDNVCWYRVEFVDVDLTLLVSLGAHEHRSADQQDVGVRVPVYVNGLQDAAKIGTDLHTQKRSTVTATILKE